jgi:hypothetical protein
MSRDYKYFCLQALKTIIDDIDNPVNHFVTVDAGVPSLQHPPHQSQ